MHTQVTLGVVRDGSGAAPTRRKGMTGGGHRWLVVSIPLIALVGWVVVNHPYEPGAGVGYALGVVGGSAMLVLLLYPLRKYMRAAKGLGPLRYWFRLHMLCGLLGPAMILFHTTFHVGSINAAVALSCMLLVAASGIVGRFLYRRIHHGLYGSRATLNEARQKLEELLAELGPQLERVPELKRGLESFMNRAAQKSGRWWVRVAGFVLLGWWRRRAVSAVKRALRQTCAAGTAGTAVDSGDRQLKPGDLLALLKTVDLAFQGIHRTAQFSTYERLFSLWHVAHVPFVYLFVLTAVVHVVAVHVY